MNDIALPIDDISKTDTETLRNHLARALKMTAQALVYLAAIWKELERRGEDLSDLRTSLSDYLPRIADGTLDPDLVVKYAGRKMLIKAIGNLPLEQQCALAVAGTVPAVVVENGLPEIDEAFPLMQIKAHDVRFIFSESGIRPVSEQVELRNRNLSRVAPRKRAARDVHANVKDGTIVVSGSPARVESVVRALSDIYGFDVAAILEREKTTRKALSAKVP